MLNFLSARPVGVCVWRAHKGQFPDAHLAALLYIIIYPQMEHFDLHLYESQIAAIFRRRYH